MYKKQFREIAKLIEECTKTPFTGTGKPEVLKHNLAGYWSRKINQEHRLVCRVTGDFILIVLSKPLMLLMKQPQNVVDLATPYIDWVAFSLIPVIVYQGYKQFADGLGKTKYSMYAIFLTNVVHLFFNYVLIYGVWGFRNTPINLQLGAQFTPQLRQITTIGNTYYSNAIRYSLGVSVDIPILHFWHKK